MSAIAMAASNPSRLNRLATAIDAFSEWSGRAVSWLTLAMVLMTFLIVVLRYLFDIGWIAMQESVLYLHSIVFLVGAAYTLQRDGHVRVDIFYSKMPPRARAWVDLAGVTLLLLPTCGAILWYSLDYVAASWSFHESSREAGGLGGVYLLKSMVLIAAVMLIAQGMAVALRALLVLGARDA